MKLRVQFQLDMYLACTISAAADKCTCTNAPFYLKTQLFSNPETRHCVLSAWLWALLNCSKPKISTVPCSYKCFLLQCCTSTGSEKTSDAWQRSGEHSHKTTNTLKLFVVVSVQEPLPLFQLLPFPAPPVVPEQLWWRCTVS